MQVALVGLISPRLALLSFLFSVVCHPVWALFWFSAVAMTVEPLDKAGLVGLTSSRLALFSFLFSEVCQVVQAIF